MAEQKSKKEQLAEIGNQNAALVVNNSFVDGLVNQLKEKEKYGLAFPSDYSYQNELMGAYLVLKETQDSNKKPVLQSCSQESIANTLLDMVTMGLSIQKKQCYPIAYNGKLQLQVSVFGNTMMARRNGMKDIDAMVVYEGDKFKYVVSECKIVSVEHEQDFMNIDITKIKGAYAIATMQDGSKKYELMTIAQIEQAWKQGFGYKKDGNGTHQKFTDQMCLKTVKNRLLKNITRTFGNALENEVLDNNEKLENTDIVLENSQYDIENNENLEDFEYEDDIVEKVTGEIEDTDNLPDFMKMKG